MSLAQVLSFPKERKRVMQEMLGRKNLSDQERLWSFTRHQEQVATYQTDEWHIKATSLPGSHTLRNRPLNLVCHQPALATLPPLTGLLWSGMALPVSLAVLHKYAMSPLTSTSKLMLCQHRTGHMLLSPQGASLTFSLRKELFYGVKVMGLEHLCPS